MGKILEFNKSVTCVIACFIRVKVKSSDLALFCKCVREKNHKMKNLKLLLLLLLVWQFTVTSCKKSELDKNEKDVSETPLKFTEIKTNTSFTWSTTRKINLELKPIANDSRSSVLKVIDTNGNVYFRKLQKASEKFSGSIEVPIHLKTLKYVYGGIQKEFNTNIASVNVELK